MTQERPKGKRKYTAPATVSLGDTASASGDCRGGETNVDGDCEQGTLNQGGLPQSKCSTGLQNIGFWCYAGGTASGPPACSTGTTAP